MRPRSNDDTGVLSGGPPDNPYVDYSGGDGPGQCSDQGLPNYWVSTSNRNLAVTDTDFSHGGLGPGITLTRTWNMPRTSGISVFGPFGDRWTSTYDMLIDHKGQSEQPWGRYVKLKRGSGQRFLYYTR